MSDLLGLQNSTMQMAGQVLGSLASASIGAASSKAIQKMMFEQQQHLMDKQQGINKETMEIQHNYNVEDYYRALTENSPAEMAKRYRAAGLSDAAAAMAAGNIQNGQSVSATTSVGGSAPSPPQMPTQFLDNLNFDVLGILRSIMSLRKEKAEADKVEKENEVYGDILLTDLDAKRADINLKRQSFDQFMQSFPYTLRSLIYKSRADEKLPELRDLELRNSRANAEMVEQNVQLARQQFGFLEKMNDKQLEKMQAEINNVKKQYEVFQSQISLNKSQASLNAAHEGLVGVQTENAEKAGKGIDLDNAAKDVQRILMENGSPETVAQRVGTLIASGKIKLDNLDKALDGTRNYIHYGHKWFGADPITRDFLFYNFDEGASSASKLGLHTLGGIFDVSNALFNNSK